MSAVLLVTVVITSALVAAATSTLAGHWTLKRSFDARFAVLEDALQVSMHSRPVGSPGWKSDTGPAGRADTRPTGGADTGPPGDSPRERGRATSHPPGRWRWPIFRRPRRRARPAPDAPQTSLPIEDPLGTRVVSGAARSARAVRPGPTTALGRSARKGLPIARSSGSALALRSAAASDRALPLRPNTGTNPAVAATLVIHPGNGESSGRVLTGDRSSWRVGADPDADIVVPDVGIDVLIGRNGDVWTAASEGPIDDNVTLDAVTLPTVPMPWPPSRKLRVGAITMTLEGIAGPPATLEDLWNETHADLAGRYAAHANHYALALARSGKERAESITAAALACFDSRLLDPARGATLAAMNMTLARRAHDDSRALDVIPPELLVGIAGFDRSGRLRAAANFPMAVWVVTDTGSVPLGQVGTAGGTSPVEIVTVPIDDEALRKADRPLLLVAAGPDLSVVGGRIRNFSTLNATAAQLVAAVLGPADTDAPIAAAAAARAGIRARRSQPQSRFAPVL
jgi:hypothetical protein